MRLLEAARFMWIDGLEQMMRSEWAAAAETLSLAAAKKDGWGWAVNYGDIWISESAARLVHGAELVHARNGLGLCTARTWFLHYAELVSVRGGLGFCMVRGKFMHEADLLQAWCEVGLSTRRT